MVQIWSNNHVFKHSFAQTSLAYWRKYPSVQRPDVVAVDLIKKDYDPETGILKTRRLITMDMNVPGWVSKLFGISARAYFVEDAIIDSNTKTISTTSRNVSFSNLVESVENCVYEQHAENNGWTNFVQTANVRATGFYGFGSAIEDLMMNSFRKNVSKGRELMELTINSIKKEAEEGLIWVEGIGNKLKVEGEEIASELKELSRFVESGMKTDPLSRVSLNNLN